jgi:hypothetical protein
MMKLIIVSFAMFVLAATAVAGSRSPSSAPPAEAAATTPCQAARLLCKADCADLNGGALGACLRACDVEYQQCLAGHAAAPEEDVPELELAEELATPPGQCYQQLDLCLDHCDGDIYCNRQCAKQYQTCMGH